MILYNMKVRNGFLRQTRSKVFLFLTLSSGVFWLSAISTVVAAQEFGRIPINVAAKKTTTSTVSKTNVRKNTPRIQQVKTVVKEIKTTKVVKVRTSNLTVSSQVEAEILIEQLNAAGTSIKSLTAVIKDEKPENEDSDQLGSVEFEGIAPGNYRITATLEGYDSAITTIEVEKEKTVGIPLNLEPIKYQLVIQTNISEGEIRYAPAKLISKDARGLLNTKETGGYCIAPIRNGKAFIQELRKGYYNLDIRPSANAIEYQPVLTAINVPNEVLENAEEDSDKPQSYQIDLDKKISTETFATAWTNEDWVLPTGWRLNKSLRSNRTTGIALPRSEQYRYYTNFEMISDITSLDDTSVGFVLRAQDDKNYYLIQISGAKASEPFVAKGFIVQKGQAVQIFSNPISHFSKTIASGKSFRVIIKGRENVFEVYIEDSETAELKPLGNIIDRDRYFRKGAIGIGGVGTSNFEVASFTVCASSCQ